MRVSEGECRGCIVLGDDLETDPHISCFPIFQIGGELRLREEQHPGCGERRGCEQALRPTPAVATHKREHPNQIRHGKATASADA